MIASCINERRWPYSLVASVLTRNWLGGKDSNLRYRIQSPGPYRLATAHPRTSTKEVHPPALKIGSFVIESSLAPTFGDHSLILPDYFLLDHRSRFVINRMSDILISTVFSLFTGHGYEIPGGAPNDLKVSDYKTVIQSDGYISPKFVLVDRKDPNLCNLHRDLLLRYASFRRWASRVSLSQHLYQKSFALLLFFQPEKSLLRSSPGIKNAKHRRTAA